MDNIFEVHDVKTKADIINPYPPVADFNNDVPIVIENGSYQCKVGWSFDDRPRLIFKNVIAKLRGKKDTEVQIGNAIPNLEVVRWLLKTQFDKNIVTHFDAQEQIFDYSFSHLGISTEGKINHPILITEAPSNPNYSRQLMSELLFECYNIPKLSYGIDCLYSFNYNNPNLRDSLIISCGYQTTHIIPFLNGKVCSSDSRRINIGGSQMTSFMHRLMQLKYPVHSTAITLSRAENWLSNHCRIACDYREDLVKWSDVDFYCDHVHKLQLPFNVISQSNASIEAQKERKLQQVKRLQEMNAKRREEKLQADEIKLKELQDIQQLFEESDEDVVYQALNNMGFNCFGDCRDEMEKISARINRTKAKMNNAQNEEPKVKKICLESQISAYGSLELYLEDVKQRRLDILDARSIRKQKRADMAKRRTLASQQRMKIISQLAAEKKKEDNFGANEDDWQVYKSINKEAGDTDSEEEQEKLNEYEQVLIEHDPDFKKDVDIEGFDINSAEYYQLHLDTEQIRVPELLFQPSMMGFEQAGLAEVIDFVLKKFTPEEQNKLCQNVFLTGGPALISGFKERLEKDLLELRPFKSEFKVTLANDPEFDSWFGARNWAKCSDNIATYAMSKAEYEEYGDGYFKEHQCSNSYFETPKTKISSVLNKEAKVTTPIIPAKRQMTVRTKQPRVPQLRKNVTSS